MATFTGKMQLRRGTTSNWVSNNPAGADGEPNYDTTAKQLKVFDGVNPWSQLGWTTNPALITPPTSGWSAYNGGSVSADLDGRTISLPSAAGDNVKGELRTLSPAINYTATFYFDWTMPGINYSHGGIMIKNSGGNSFIMHEIVHNSGTGNFGLITQQWTSATTGSTSYASRAINSLTNGIPHWFRVRDDGTSRYYEYSYNNVSWQLLNSTTRTDFITPDQIGWAGNSNNSGGTYTSIIRLRSFAIT